MKIFHTTQIEKDAYEGITQKLIKYIWSHDVYYIAGWLLHAFCENFSTIAVVYFGTELYRQGKVTLGEMTMFLQYAAKLSHQIRHSSWLVKEFTTIVKKASTVSISLL